MALFLFQNKEQEYMQWLQGNPSGFVLTTLRSILPTYMSLHRSDCKTISKYMSNMAKDAFTGRNYIKVCSNYPLELSAWIKKNGGSGFTTLCSKCKPAIDNVKKLQVEFERDVRQSTLSTPEERGKRLLVASKQPELISTTTILFKRNPDVVADVLFRARGNCQNCKKEAPFTRASDGTPYLEVHHIVPLSEGGHDSVANAIALCPNCHRRNHYGKK